MMTIISQLPLNILHLPIQHLTHITVPFRRSQVSLLLRHGLSSVLIHRLLDLVRTLLVTSLSALLLDDSVEFIVLRVDSEESECFSSISGGCVGD
jgi:hypothetical protein